MENTLHAAGAGSGQVDGRPIELTASGRFVLVLAIASAGFGAWAAYQRHAVGEPARASHAASPQQVALQQADGAVAQLPQMNAPTVAQLTQELVKERSERNAQTAAWRALTEANRQQIASLNAGLQALDAKIDALQKTSQPLRSSRDGVVDAASSAKSLRKAVDAAKATAQVDVTSLPVETASAQSLNATGFGNGVVEIGGEKITVGQSFQPGETIVAIDPVSRSIVTNRRIINVTN